MDTRIEPYGLSRPGVGHSNDCIGRAHLIDEDCLVGVGEYKVVRSPAKLMCIGLGSCVGIAIFDLQAQVAGVAHAMLPRYEEGRDKINASKYADSAIMIMVDDLLSMGATRGHLRAKMAGGAQMFSFISSDTLNIGLRNSESARAALKGENIPLIAEDVGGTRGRTVTFSSENASYRIQMGNDTSSI
jgi:chemotaxis protein CheD